MKESLIININITYIVNPQLVLNTIINKR